MSFAYQFGILVCFAAQLAFAGCKDDVARKGLEVNRRGFLISAVVVSLSPRPIPVPLGGGITALPGVLSGEQIELIRGLAHYAVNYATYSKKEGWVLRRWQLGLGSPQSWVPEASMVTRGMTPRVYKIVDEVWVGRFGKFSRFAQTYSTARAGQLDHSYDRGDTARAAEIFARDVKEDSIASALKGIENSTWPKFEAILLRDGFSPEAIVVARKQFFSLVTSELNRLAPIWARFIKSSAQRTLADLRPAVSALEASRRAKLEARINEKAKLESSSQHGNGSELPGQAIVLWPRSPTELFWIHGDLSDVRLTVTMRAKDGVEASHGYVLEFCDAGPVYFDGGHTTAITGAWLVEEVTALRRENPEVEMAVTVTSFEGRSRSAVLNDQGEFIPQY